MKKITKIIFIQFLLLAIISCGDKIPTPIGPTDPDIDPQLEIEIVSQQPGDQVYTNGYDSTASARCPENL